MPDKIRILVAVVQASPSWALGACADVSAPPISRGLASGLTAGFARHMSAFPSWLSWGARPPATAAPTRYSTILGTDKLNLDFLQGIDVTPTPLHDEAASSSSQEAIELLPASSNAECTPGLGDDVLIPVVGPGTGAEYASGTTSLDGLNRDKALGLAGGTPARVTTADVSDHAALTCGTTSSRTASTATPLGETDAILVLEPGSTITSTVSFAPSSIRHARSSSTRLLSDHTLEGNHVHVHV